MRSNQETEEIQQIQYTSVENSPNSDSADESPTMVVSSYKNYTFLKYYSQNMSFKSAFSDKKVDF